MNRWYSYTTYGNNAEALYSIEYRGNRFVLKVDNEFSLDKDSSDRKILSLDFRIGASGIITPFIEWKFKLDDKERLFKQITLAPMIESDLAEESFKRFLAATVRQNIKIKQSSINLRF